MVMKEFIKSFPTHISHAIKISNSVDMCIEPSNINNILIIGQGGSAIGGVIANNILKEKITIPILVNQDYKIPSFVGDKTLVIASSYSGDTEETLSALIEAYKKTRYIFCICSGGKMLNFAEKNSIKYVLLPSGAAPRAMLAYSVVQIILLISKTCNIFKSIVHSLLDTHQYLIEQQDSIIAIATETVMQISNKMPFIYAFPEFEGVAIRFKQQLNENSKRHACYNLIPEMNHNEIVPWVKQNMCAIPIFINGKTSDRNSIRMKISIDSIKNSVEDIIELISPTENSYMQQYFYLIHLVDWISIIVAEKDSVDPNDISLIHAFKDQLKQI